MERGPSVAMKISRPRTTQFTAGAFKDVTSHFSVNSISNNNAMMVRGRPAVTAPRSSESGLSFRIPTPRSELFKSIKTGNELKLGSFTINSQSATVEGPVRTPRMFEQTVPFVAPTMDFAAVKDLKPAPTKLTYFNHHTPKIRHSEFISESPKKVSEMLNHHEGALQVQHDNINTKITGTTVGIYNPEKFVAYPAPTVKKKDEETTSEQEPAKEVAVTKQLAVIRSELQTMSATTIAVQESPFEKVTDTKVAQKIQTTFSSPKESSSRVQTASRQEEIARAKAELKEKNPTVTNRLSTKEREKRKNNLIYAKKKDEEKKKTDDNTNDERMKFIVDRKAKFARYLITVKSALPLLIWGTISNDFQFSGEDLGLPEAPPKRAHAGAAKKLGVDDPSWVIWVTKVRKIPKTSFGNLLATALQAIDEVPPVDLKPLVKAKGEKEAPQSAIALLLGWQKDTSTD